ncbi:MAG TPA: efflux RND transporter periplasmic adaptor subunit [Rhodanobacteraceae bacterium]|nr:efflux RND transporter periplasmic adaptor subunit [Rhodanobacteraceae bacterium]
MNSSPSRPAAQAPRQRPAPARRLCPLALAAALLLGGCTAGRNAAGPAASATAAVAYGGVTLSQAQRKHIKLHKVSEADFRRTLDTAGTVDYDQDQATEVLAPFSGPVTQLLVSVGDQVTAGQALARVDSSDFATAIAAYRKALASARTARRLADQARELLAHKGVSRREEEQAQTSAVSAEADRDAALQALKALQVGAAVISAIQRGQPVPHASGVIRAPIAGTVVAKSITPGQLLQAGSTSCFTIADLSRMWVHAQVFAADVALVQPGDPAEVELGNGQANLPGTVTTVSAMVDPATGAVTARVVADNPHDVLKKDMYVRVLIHAAQPGHGLLVPVSAVLRDDDNRPFVYVVQADGSFARRHVSLGYRDGDRYAIASGLKAGQRVVSEGGIFVRFMQSQ